MSGGVYTLNYRPVFGKIDNGFSGAVGVGYTYFLNKHWGLSSGLEYAFYQNKIGLNNFAEANSTFDIFNNPIIYHTFIDSYSEKQSVGLFNIPVSVLFQSGSRHKFYLSAGIKLGLPAFGKYRSNNFVLTVSGYYPD